MPHAELQVAVRHSRPRADLVSPAGCLRYASAAGTHGHGGTSPKQSDRLLGEGAILAIRDSQAAVSPSAPAGTIQEAAREADVSAVNSPSPPIASAAHAPIRLLTALIHALGLLGGLALGPGRHNP